MCHKRSSNNNILGCTYRNEDKTITIITDSNNEIIFAVNFDGSKDLKFKVARFNAKTSQKLVFTNLAYPSYFQKGEELRIWYTEDLYDYKTHDNLGTHCVRAYAKF